MEPQIDIRKQAASADVDGFINTLTLLLEGNKLSDSTKETLKQMLCNAANTAGEGDISGLKDIRDWLSNALNIASTETATAPENEDGSKGFVIYPDEAETQHALGFIMKGISEDGLYILANILVRLRDMTSEG